MRAWFAMAAGVALAGCATTEEANQQMKSRWIGQPSDLFFSQYGPPRSSFPLNNGGAVYTWRGGETTVTIPAQYRTATPTQPTAPLAGQTSSQTVTTVAQTAPGTTVTETRTSSTSIGVSLPQAQPAQVLVSPERRENLYCEAQISTNEAGVISNIQTTSDTRGANFALSRCAEVFGVS